MRREENGEEIGERTEEQRGEKIEEEKGEKREEIEEIEEKRRKDKRKKEKREKRKKRGGERGERHDPIQGLNLESGFACRKAMAILISNICSFICSIYLVLSCKRVERDF